MNWLKKCLLMSLAGLAGMAGFIGCGGPIYDNTAKPLAAEISPRAKWRVRGDLRNPQAAIDGTIGTAARSDGAAPASLTIDLGKPCFFNMVVIDHGGEPNGFSRRTSLLTSMDGQNFSPCYSVPGTRRVTSLCMISPVICRYIRLEASAPGGQPWNVAEVYLY